MHALFGVATILSGLLGLIAAGLAGHALQEWSEKRQKPDLLLCLGASATTLILIFVTEILMIEVEGGGLASSSPLWLAIGGFGIVMAAYGIFSERDWKGATPWLSLSLFAMFGYALLHSEQMVWREARRADSVVLLRDFARRFPNSANVDKANGRLAELRNNLGFLTRLQEHIKADAMNVER